MLLNILRNTLVKYDLLFQTMKVKCVLSSWKYLCLFFYSLLQTRNNMTTQFRKRQQKTRLLMDTGFGVSLKPQTTTAHYLKHICWQWQAPAWRNTTFATNFNNRRKFVSLHIQLLISVFPLSYCYATDLIASRSGKVPSVSLTKVFKSHWEASCRVLKEDTCHGWISRHCPLHITKKIAFMSIARELIVSKSVFIPSDTQVEAVCRIGSLFIWKHSHTLGRGIIAHLNQCFSPYGPPAPMDHSQGPNRGQQDKQAFWAQRHTG